MKVTYTVGQLSGYLLHVKFVFGICLCRTEVLLVI